MLTSHTLPRIAVRAIGGGLFLMAFFTLMWAGIAEGGLQGSDHWLVLVAFSVLCIVFVIGGIRLFIRSKDFPVSMSEEDKLEGTRMGKWYAIIFGIEGTLIPVVCVALLLLKQERFILPAIALVVGLHFYPMASVFNRKLDYYLATWVCLVAITCICMMLYTGYPQTMIQACLGIGVAVATSAYGIYMMLEGNRMLKQ